MLLDIQVVVLNVWSADVLVHREEVRRSEVTEDRRRTPTRVGHGNRRGGARTGGCGQRGGAAK